MKATRPWIIPSLLVVCCTLSSLVQGGDETTIKGFITHRTGETITVRPMDSNTSTTIVLTDVTKVERPQGIFRHKEMSRSFLVPGLAVEVKGITNGQGQFVARTVRFSGHDLKLASAIQSGLVPTSEAVQANTESIADNKQAITVNAQGIDANRQRIGAAEDEIATHQAEVQKRFSDLSEYDSQTNVVLKDFPVGKSRLSQKDKAALMQLAQNAKQLKGYLIQVQGFCDSSGTAELNQELSRDRAEAVIAYLEQQADVPMRHILAPGAMGTVNPVASNQTATGRSKNRRVEVTVLINRALASN